MIKDILVLVSQAQKDIVLSPISKVIHASASTSLFFFFLDNSGVRISLQAPQLILEPNSAVHFVVSQLKPKQLLRMDWP